MESPLICIDGRGLGWQDGLSNNLLPARLAPTWHGLFLDFSMPSSGVDVLQAMIIVSTKPLDMSS